MANLSAAYASGSSIPDLARNFGMSRSYVRLSLIQAGVRLRSRAEGCRLAGHKVSAALRGRTRNFSDSHRAAISRSKTGKGRGFSVKRRGYVIVTMGPDKHRGVHDVIMEKQIGRRLRRNEVVHHIDGDTYNNALDNLQLMNRAAHTRLHRTQYGQPQ